MPLPIYLETIIAKIESLLCIRTAQYNEKVKKYLALVRTFYSFIVGSHRMR